jgi:RecA-family ATPase
MDMVKSALEYSSMGFCILPVSPNDKKPLLTSWTRFTKEKPTEEMITNWFTALKPVGVGMVTGSISGVIVVDIDTKSGLDYMDITNKYPTEIISRTPSGGFHLFYRHPGFEVRNRVDVIKGVDVRGDGGFIVLPPTSRNGEFYSWISFGNIGEYPTELLGDKESHGLQSNNEKWISDIMKGVKRGNRNNSAARLAGYLFGKAIPFDIIVSILYKWNENNDPPMNKMELDATLQSVFKRSQRVTVTKIKKESMAEYSGFDLVLMDKYFRKYGGEGVEWAVDGWMPDHSIVFLVSPPESYKTWMLLDLAVSIASGEPFLGEFKVNNKGPVIIIQQEDSHSGITERLSVILQSRLNLHPVLSKEHITMPILPSIPIYIHPSRSLRFDDEKIMNELEEAINRIRPTCVIIDPLYSAAKVENYMADSAEDMFRLKKFRDDYGCSFVIAHHSKKNVDPNSMAREDGWGSQFMNAFLEAGWQVRRNQQLDDNQIVVRRHSKTMGNMDMLMLTFDISTRYPMKYEVTVSEYSPISSRNYAQGELYNLLMDEPMNVTDAAKKIGKHKSTVSRQLKQLETTNMIEKMPDGRYKVKEEYE